MAVAEDAIVGVEEMTNAAEVAEAADEDAVMTNHVAKDALAIIEMIEDLREIQEIGATEDAVVMTEPKAHLARQKDHDVLAEEINN